jgi:hypothetical protein
MDTDDMKSKAFLTGLVVFLLLGSLVAFGSTDGCYVAASIGFFLVCVIYAEACGRL